MKLHCSILVLSSVDWRTRMLTNNIGTYICMSIVLTFHSTLCVLDKSVRSPMLTLRSWFNIALNSREYYINNASWAFLEAEKEVSSLFIERDSVVWNSRLLTLSIRIGPIFSFPCQKRKEKRKEILFLLLADRADFLLLFMVRLFLDQISCVRREDGGDFLGLKWKKKAFPLPSALFIGLGGGRQRKRIHPTHPCPTFYSSNCMPVPVLCMLLFCFFKR